MLQLGQHLLHPRPEQRLQVLKRNPRLLRGPAGRVQLGRRDRWHVIDVGLGAVLRMQRQRHLVLLHQLVDRPIRIVQITDETHPARTLARTGRGHPLIDPRETEDALLRMALHLVEIDLLVWAGLLAEAVTIAAPLVDQHDAVLLPLADGLARAGLKTGRVGAMVADARQVEVVAVGELPAADILIPIGALAGMATVGFQRNAGIAAEGHLVVVEIPGLAVFLHRGTVPGLGHPVAEAPAHALETMGGTDPRLGVHRVPQHVGHAVALGPQALAGDGTGLTAEAFVQVHDHGDLSFAHDGSLVQASRARSAQSMEKALMPARSSLPPRHRAKPMPVFLPAASGATSPP